MSQDRLKKLLGPSATRDAVPAANHTYVILDRSSNAAIAIVDGRLRLEADLSQAGNCYWRCVEKDGWLGFYETELERYLGHDFWWNFTADNTEFGEYGYFVPRRHPDGGYLLLAPRLSGLLRVVAGKDGALKGVDTGETLWEFVRVDRDNEEEDDDDDDDDDEEEYEEDDDDSEEDDEDKQDKDEVTQGKGDQRNGDNKAHEVNGHEEQNDDN
jgi:hypothetical protein